MSGAKTPHDSRQKRPTAGRVSLVGRTCAPFVVVRPACGRGSLPAGINMTGATPTERGGIVDTGVDTGVDTPPPRLTAPAVKKGGSLPSNPSPLARLGLSGLASKARTKPAGRGAVSVDTPPLDLLTPPPTSASTKPCPAPCPAPCHGTSPKRAGFPSSKYPHRLRLIDPPSVQNRSHVSACSRRCARADCDDVPRRKSSAKSWPSCTGQDGRNRLLSRSGRAVTRRAAAQRRRRVAP